MWFFFEVILPLVNFGFFIFNEWHSLFEIPNMKGLLFQLGLVVLFHITQGAKMRDFLPKYSNLEQYMRQFH